MFEGESGGSGGTSDYGSSDNRGNGGGSGDTSPPSDTETLGQAQAAAQEQADLAKIKADSYTAEQAWEAYQNDMAQARQDEFFAQISADGVQNEQNDLNDALAQQRIYLQAANDARNAAADFLLNLVKENQLSKNQFKRIATISGAWDPATGKIYVSAKIMTKGGPKRGEPGYFCAETLNCETALGDNADPAKLSYTVTINPATKSEWEFCSACQGNIAQYQVALSGAKGHPEGSWVPYTDMAQEQMQQMSSDFQSQILNMQEVDPNFDLNALNEGEAPSMATEGGGDVVE